MRNMLTKASLGVFGVLGLVTPVMAQTYDYYWDSTVSAADAGLFGLSGIALFAVWCCVLCVPLILSLVFAFVVYNDAKKNNVENGVLWAILTFFFNLIGLLVYFLAIRPDAIKKNNPVTVEEKK